MIPIRPKKHLGQHFLNDMNIARKITGSLFGICSNVLEIGPGTGILTGLLLENNNINYKAIEIDPESVAFLYQKFQLPQDSLIEGDFLQTDMARFYDEPFQVIGNFPYNISSQIFFRVLEYKHLIPAIVGMVQKEVALRMASPPGNKTYGILSVLLQAWYDIEYLFTVNENVFTPPPKVKSAVIRLTRNDRTTFECNEKLFVNVVKTSFNQRRKTLRNSLSSLMGGKNPADLPFMTKRAEQLSVLDFITLTRALE